MTFSHRDLARISTRWLPFADVASDDLPLSRLLRLSLFQVTVGMATVLMIGTLNRVMIVEFGVSAALVSLMVAIPLLFAPFRALIGFRSDTHRSAFGWRRTPYLWFGTLFQFGGLSIMPFALLVLSGDNGAPVILGQVAAAISFLFVGAGMQTAQTAGLALACDLAPEEARPRVVAWMYVMLLLGMVGTGLVFGAALIDFTPLDLIQVIQGAAVATIVLNVVAMWKQEGRGSRRVEPDEDLPFREAWRRFTALPGARRFLLALFLGTAAFNMQDVLLEAYGGQILKLAVSQTTFLTALYAAGALVAYLIAARALTRGWDAYRVATFGLVAGLPGFSLVILSGAAGAPVLFQAGVVMIGFGAGLFAVATLSAAMSFETGGRAGLALGAWGAVQALGAGVAIAFGGVARDLVGDLATHGVFGTVLATASTGYAFVYHLELLLLFCTLAVIGPLARHAGTPAPKGKTRFGLAEIPS
jgi:BCD family chlorophyll transporter-like MFS transporter